MNARKVLNGVLALAMVLAALPLVNGSSAAQLAPATTGVIATINVGSSPRGVAVNANTNRVYVVNSGQQLPLGLFQV